MIFEIIAGLAERFNHRTLGAILAICLPFIPIYFHWKETRFSHFPESLPNRVATYAAILVSPFLLFYFFEGSLISPETLPILEKRRLAEWQLDFDSRDSGWFRPHDFAYIPLVSFAAGMAWCIVAEGIKNNRRQKASLANIEKKKKSAAQAKADRESRLEAEITQLKAKIQTLQSSLSTKSQLLETQTAQFYAVVKMRDEAEEKLQRLDETQASIRERYREHADDIAAIYPQTQFETDLCALMNDKHLIDNSRLIVSKIEKSIRKQAKYYELCDGPNGLWEFFNANERELAPDFTRTDLLIELDGLKTFNEFAQMVDGAKSVIAKMRHILTKKLDDGLETDIAQEQGVALRKAMTKLSSELQAIELDENIPDALKKQSIDELENRLLQVRRDLLSFERKDSSSGNNL